MRRRLSLVLALLAVDAFAAGRGRAARNPGIPPQPPAGWTAPACTTTFGLPGFYFTRDEGATVSNNALPVPVDRGGVLVVPTDVPNRMFGMLGKELYDSADAGCSWTPRASTPLGPTEMLAAPGGRAYAWSYAEARLLRIAAASADAVALPDPPKAIGVDPADAAHLMLVTRTKIYESSDAGAGWSERAVAPTLFVEAAAVDPRDVRHLAIGYTQSAGAIGRVAVSRDGGMTWQTSQTQVKSIWELAFSPADPNVIWLHANSEPFGPLQFHRSDDGGVTFGFRMTPFFNANSLTLTPSLTEPHIAAFAGDAGLAIVDAAAATVRRAGQGWDTVTWSPAPGVIYLTKAFNLIHDP